jgi:uncharacterized protein YqjF (DUF2071 family)
VHPSLRRVSHRPWPLPEQPWVGRQSWRDLLFAHWPVAAADLARLVPPPLRIQEFDGTSWVGVIPFRMADVMLRGIPALPWISAFPELNIRLYVEHEGKPGVWFLSLDAANRLAVWTARKFVHLPYFHARMSAMDLGDGISYASQRIGQERVDFDAKYAPCSEPCEAATGSLEHWLTERYCLYAQSPSGQLFRTEIHHVPWPLQKANAEIARNGMLAPHDLKTGTSAPLLHFSRRVDVVTWAPRGL